MRSKGDHSRLVANPAWRIGIVHSAFYPEEVGGLIEGAMSVLREAGIPEENITLHSAPGCFEIPLIGAALASKKSVDGLIALGVIVEGETHHGTLIAEEAARGIMDVQTRQQMPFAFEILYVKDIEQARARAGKPDNKGGEAARAVLQSLMELRKIRR